MLEALEVVEAAIEVEDSEEVIEEAVEVSEEAIEEVEEASEEVLQEEDIEIILNIHPILSSAICNTPELTYIKNYFFIFYVLIKQIMLINFN